MQNGGKMMSESEKNLASSGRQDLRRTTYAEQEIASWDEETDWDEVHRQRRALEASVSKYRSEHPE